MACQERVAGFFALILSVVLGAAPCFALTSDTDKAVEIPNFQIVSKELWRGSAPSESDLTELAKRGVKTVVNLRKPGAGTSKEETYARKLGLKYVHIPMGFGSPSPKSINQFLAIVTNPEYQPVYVHCLQGADRTGSVVGVYRMLVQGWTFDKAYSEMRSHHFKPWLVTMKHTVAAWEPVSPIQAKVAEK
jgi:protein tyrosine/serine phosphatase